MLRKTSLGKGPVLCHQLGFRVGVQRIRLQSRRILLYPKSNSIANGYESIFSRSFVLVQSGFRVSDQPTSPMRLGTTIPPPNLGCDKGLPLSSETLHITRDQTARIPFEVEVKHAPSRRREYGPPGQPFLAEGRRPFKRGRHLGGHDSSGSPQSHLSSQNHS